MSYANKTSVPIDRSMSQIRQLLFKAKSSGVATAETTEGAVTKFIFEGKPYKFKINYPSFCEERIVYTSTGRERTDAQKFAEVEAEKRRLWRCKLLYIKAAVEAHQNGLMDLQRSFVGHMQLPSGKTFYEVIEGNLERFEANPSFMLEQ